MKLETRVLPPIVFLVTAVLMLILAFLTSEISFTVVRLVIALAIISIAVTIALLGVKSFRKHETTLHPTNPEKTTTLVTTGIYAFTRNPMYLAMFLVLISWGIILGVYVTLLMPFGFVAYIYRFQIVPEERVLTEKFGETYTKYKKEVARWLYI